MKRALSGSTVFGDQTHDGSFVFAGSMLPGTWRFKVTNSNNPCYDIWGPTKQVPNNGSYRLTCSVLTDGFYNYNPTVQSVSEDDQGELVIEFNDVGDLLDGGSPYMYAGDALISSNGDYVLLYQSDGDLVKYNDEYVGVWSTDTGGSGGGSAHVHLQDTNLVVYDASVNAVWYTSNAYASGAYMWMQNDGNLVIYDGTDQPVWSTGIQSPKPQSLRPTLYSLLRGLMPTVERRHAATH